MRFAAVVVSVLMVTVESLQDKLENAELETISKTSFIDDSEHPDNTTMTQVDFVLKATSYLPSEASAHAPFRKGKVQLIRQQLEYLGSNGCDFDRGMEPMVIEFGFGATMFSTVKPILHAMKHGYCLLNPKGFNYFYNLHECSGGYTSLFQPMGSHKYRFNPLFYDRHYLDGLSKKDEYYRLDYHAVGEDFYEEYSKKIAGEMEEMLQHTLYKTYKKTPPLSQRTDNATSCASWFEVQQWTYGLTTTGTGLELQEECDSQYSYSKNGGDMLPPDFRDDGLFFTVAYIAEFATRPQANLSELAAWKRKSIGLPKDEKIIGIHYEESEHCPTEFNKTDDSMSCQYFADYMAQAKLVKAKYGISNILVVSESADVQNEFAKYPEFTFFYEPSVFQNSSESDRHDAKTLVSAHEHVASYFEHHEVLSMFAESGTEKKDGCQEAKSSIVNLMLLSRTDVLIGRFTSNYDRLAYALMCAHAGKHMPYISMDSAWCFDFALKSGNNRGEAFYC